MNKDNIKIIFYVDFIFEIRDADTEDQLNEVTNKDETVVLLTQSGFTNEFVSLLHRHRACQYIMIHVFSKAGERSWTS